MKIERMRALLADLVGPHTSDEAYAAAGELQAAGFVRQPVAESAITWRTSPAHSGYQLTRAGREFIRGTE